MEVKAIARRWGSSLAVIIPRTLVDENNIQENDKISIEIKKKPLVGEFFGKFPEWKKSTQKIKDEMRKGW